MRRKEREITQRQDMIAVLKRCSTIRLGINDTDIPYVVPVSFGMKIDGETVTLYFHGPKSGHKCELIRKNNQVCVEADIFDKIEKTDIGITTRYESVIGRGIVELTDETEKISGLKAILQHYGYLDYPLHRCKGLEMTAVYKIKLLEMTGKHNLSPSMQQH